MIDILVDRHEGTVLIENHIYLVATECTEMISDVIDKAKYSGESITLRKVLEENSEFARFVKEW